MIIRVGIDWIPNDLVLLRYTLEDRAEHPAGTAPCRPEIDQGKIGVTDHGLEVLGGHFDRRHGSSQG